jgi:hypothetical protein
LRNIDLMEKIKAELAKKMSLAEAVNNIQNSNYQDLKKYDWRNLFETKHYKKNEEYLRKISVFVN